MFWLTPIFGLRVTQSRLYPFREQARWNLRAGVIVSRKRAIKR